METVKKLLSHRLFVGLNEDVLSKKLESSHVTYREFSAGEEIYSPSHREKKLGVLLCGRASVFSSGENNTALLRILEEGDTFGVANLFTEQEQFVSFIIAKKSCRVLFFPRKMIAELLLEEPAFTLNYIHFLSDRICFLNKKISCFTAGSPEKKLAFFLLSFSNENLGQYSLNINANSLSDMLNIGRASLYRAFDSLAAEGLLQKNGKQITIIDKNALKSRFADL